MKSFLLRGGLLIAALLCSNVAVKAQGIELACPAGTSPVQSLNTTDPSTGGKIRQNMCVDANGVMSFQGAASNISVPSISTLLSPQCVGNAAPCINIPPSGGEFPGPITNSGSPVITFVSGFPSPTPIVGQLGWAQVQPNCDSHAINFPSFIQPLYTGLTHAAGGTPITIVAVSPGVSVTLSTSSNITTQNGTNACFYYGPNIYSQLNIACGNVSGISGAAPQVAIGTYILDNSSNGTHSACGDVQTATNPKVFAAGLSGSGVETTTLVTAPWYNHEGDLGTVIGGQPTGFQLHDITIDGTWINTANLDGRGTPFDGNICGSVNFSVRGFYMGATAVSETFYNQNGNGLGGQASNCEVRNAWIGSGNRVFGGINGTLNVYDTTVVSRCNNFLWYSSVANNTNLNVIGGIYVAGGAACGGEDPGIIGREAAQTPTGDRVSFTNTTLCMLGSQPAINDQEPAGEIRLNNVRINQTATGECSGAFTPGTNATGVKMVSGISLRAQQSNITALGTGNTIINPAGATYYDGCNNFLNGGAGYSGGGNLFGNSCSVTGANIVSGNLVLSANWGTSAAVSAPLGDPQNFSFTLTNGTAATGTNPTITFTFPATTAPFLKAPICTVQQVGGTQAITATTVMLTPSAASTTSIVLTYNGTPTINLTEFFQGSCH